MRDTNKTITKQEIQEIQYTINNETILSINENKILKVIIVEVGLQDDEKIIDTEIYTISNELYDLLMSESPDFAIGKPSNEYREVDLWHIIDMLRTL